ncbi:hypothetical protein PRIPAC_77456 [Pristionchus pacificus]|uniref:Uncharacterized protein n=1 Tax=Pristionchus pacificus TaxID=54126 RepID=A0A2A6C4F8_PRIPA|nr:hypothetical protein PRIPAC_77456 [Pristionchus pacificus]|eukprot:PDM72933.1 hypothetical protein PRIPAC_39367 [Pristionchus pacificus]
MFTLRILSLLSIAFAVSSSLPIVSNDITEGSGDSLLEVTGDAKNVALLDTQVVEGSGEGSGVEGSGAEQVEGSGESVAAIITRLLIEGSGESA